MAEYIPIDKKLIPYEFEIELNSKVYTMRFFYNDVKDYFSVDLELNGKVLVKGQKLILDYILFKSLRQDTLGSFNPDFPKDVLIPLDPSGKFDRITFDNFGNEILLYTFPVSEFEE